MTESPSPRAGSAIGRRVGAIIVAAGHSRRMSGVDKLFFPLLGVPLLSYTLEAFQAVCAIQDVALVLNRSNLELGKALVAEQGFRKVTYVGIGGQRRQDRPGGDRQGGGFGCHGRPRGYRKSRCQRGQG